MRRRDVCLASDVELVVLDTLHERVPLASGEPKGRSTGILRIPHDDAISHGHLDALIPGVLGERRLAELERLLFHLVSPGNSAFSSSVGLGTHCHFLISIPYLQILFIRIGILSNHVSIYLLTFIFIRIFIKI